MGSRTLLRRAAGPLFQKSPTEDTSRERKDSLPLLPNSVFPPRSGLKSHKRVGKKRMRKDGQGLCCMGTSLYPDYLLVTQAVGADC